MKGVVKVGRGERRVMDLGLGERGVNLGVFIRRLMKAKANAGDAGTELQKAVKLTPGSNKSYETGTQNIQLSTLILPYSVLDICLKVTPL